MSTIRTPVGPQPSSVYWRRRLVVALGLVAVIVVIVLIVFRPGAGTPASAPTPGSSATATPTANPDGSPAACAKDQVKLEAVTDADSYSADSKPMLSLAVTNTGTTECTLEVGTDVQEYRITSGKELIWSSKDCQQDPVATTATLKPGVPVANAPFAWDRTRSSADSCDAKRDPVTAGGASYHLEVILDGVKSEETKQFLLL